MRPGRQLVAKSPSRETPSHLPPPPRSLATRSPGNTSATEPAIVGPRPAICIGYSIVRSEGPALGLTSSLDDPMPRSRQRNQTSRRNADLRADGVAQRHRRRFSAAAAETMPISSALPLEVARQAQREMDRLRRLPSGTPEAGQVRTYLQWLWSLPWDVTAPEDADLKEVELVLEREHMGLTKAKERILEYLAVRRLKPDLPGPAVCLVGPPGTGKSSLGATVARALRRPFARISVSGTTDVNELIGVSRTAPDGQPGKVLRALREAGARNPVLMIDGIDR